MTDSGGHTDFGAYLREARERRGVSLSEMSATTKISKTVLQALENNEVDRVPGGIFGRSFVRAYAEQVGLDPETSVTAFLDAFPATRTRDTGRVASSGPALNGGEQSIGRLAVGLGVISLVIVGFILYFATR